MKETQEELDFNKKMFELLQQERDGEIKFSEELGIKYGSLSILKHVPFWFHLGYGKDKKLSFGGNCYKWSNAFQLEPKYFVHAFKIINYHANISTDQSMKIMRLLKRNINTLFFCREMELSLYFNQSRIDKDINAQQVEDKGYYWHYFPDGVSSLVKIPYKDTTELYEVLK